MDVIEALFKLIVGKGRIAWQKDKIRHLEELRDYYDMTGRPEVADGIEKVVKEEYTTLARIEEKQMKRD